MNPLSFGVYKYQMNHRNSPLFKDVCILLIFLVMGASLYAQEQNSPLLDSYIREQALSFPRISEGMIAPNQSKLDAIARDAIETRPGSHEAMIIEYMNGDSKSANRDKLESALSILPQDAITLKEVLEFYGMFDDHASLNQILPSVERSEPLKKDRIYYTDMDALMNTNEILFTNGASDTRSLMMARSRSGKNYRIIRLSWLKDSGYLSHLSEQGLKVPSSFTRPSDFISKFQKMNPEKNILLSPTLNKELLLALQSQLGISGLCFNLNGRSDEHLAEDYRYLSISSNSTKRNELSKALRMNYVPFLLAVQGETDSSKERKAIKEELQDILQDNNRIDLMK